MNLYDDDKDDYYFDLWWDFQDMLDSHNDRIEELEEKKARMFDLEDDDYSVPSTTYSSTHNHTFSKFDEFVFTVTGIAAFLLLGWLIFR